MSRRGRCGTLRGRCPPPPPTAPAPEGKDLPGHSIQRPGPPLGRKRKRCGERAQNSGSQSDNSAEKLQDEFIPEAKKTCPGLPAFTASPHAKSLSPTCANGNGRERAQPSCAPSLTVAAQQHKTLECCKTEGLNTAKEDNFQLSPLQQKQAEGQKPSGKRKGKTKHLEATGGRKRSFLAMDDPFAIEDTQDLVAPPRKVMRQGVPTFHRASLPFTPFQQKLHKQLQQPPLLPTL